MFDNRISKIPVLFSFNIDFTFDTPLFILEIPEIQPSLSIPPSTLQQPHPYPPILSTQDSYYLMLSLSSPLPA